MAKIVPIPWDVITRPVKYVKAGIEQALLAVYPATSGGFVDDTSPTAIALESGQTFAGVNAGASGLGYTVFTKGLICYGEPRDGPACFLAAPDYRLSPFDTGSIDIKRGIVREDLSLGWLRVGGGDGLVALTFAGGAFHAVYCENTGGGPTRIESSFDGTTWNVQKNVFPTSDRGITGGAVAFNEENFVYAAAGTTAIETPDEDPPWAGSSAVKKLAWATANAPPPDESALVPWTYGSIDDPRGEPGAATAEDGILNQQATIAGGNKIFAAATYKQHVPVIDFGGFPRPLPVLTAAVATSANGASWTNHVLSGVQEGFFIWDADGDDKMGHSRTLAVVFVNNDEEGQDGYFICATHNFYWDQAETPAHGNIWGTVHQSSDGNTWDLIRTVGAKGDGSFNYCLSLSKIAADLSTTTIVNL